LQRTEMEGSYEHSLDTSRIGSYEKSTGKIRTQVLTGSSYRVWGIERYRGVPANC